MEKNVITHELIAGCIGGTDGGAQNAKIVKVLAIIMVILGVICLAMPDMRFFSYACWALAALCLVLIARSMHTIGWILKKEYTLRIDTCVGKGLSATGDSPNLEFADTGRCDLNFPHVVWNSEAVLKSANLYESANIGDTFYLLCVKGKRVLFVFNSKSWIVHLTQFSRNEDSFVPNK